jgi:hypothetical protein
MYYREHANISLSSGEVAYEAVAGDEPPGKHIRLARKITVRVRLIDFNSDLEVLANFGLAGLRRHRIARLSKQAYDQGALLSYEDTCSCIDSFITMDTTKDILQHELLSMTSSNLSMSTFSFHHTDTILTDITSSMDNSPGWLFPSRNVRKSINRLLRRSSCQLSFRFSPMMMLHTLPTASTQRAFEKNVSHAGSMRHSIKARS